MISKPTLQGFAGSFGGSDHKKDWCNEFFQVNSHFRHGFQRQSRGVNDASPYSTKTKKRLDVPEVNCRTGRLQSLYRSKHVLRVASGSTRLRRVCNLRPVSLTGIVTGQRAQVPLSGGYGQHLYNEPRSENAQRPASGTMAGLRATCRCTGAPGG